MREVFKLSGPSFSINSVTGADKRYKTSEARDWECGVLHQLNSKENGEKFEKLRSHFDANKHAFAVTIVVEYPREKFLTKKGTVSAHTHDVSNYEKPLIDLFFLPKYYNQPDPYGAPNLNCDDKFITRMYSQKRAGARHAVTVAIKIINL